MYCAQVVLLATMLSVPFKVRALYDYSSEYEDDLNFSENTVITVTKVEDGEWYFGHYNLESGDKVQGLFPQNFVEAVAEPVIPSRPKRASVSKAEDMETHPVQEKSVQGEPEATQVEAESEAVDEVTRKVAEVDLEPAKTGGKKNALFNKIAAFNTQKSGPVLPGQLKEEPQAQKTYFGATSSYVPSGFGHKPVKKATAVPVLQPETQTETEAPVPNLSLKERIALLRKEEEAAAHRSAEKKKKKPAPLPLLASKESLPEEPVSRGISRKSTVNQELQEDEETEKGDDIAEEEPQVELTESAVEEKDQDEGDEEEQTRRALRERMAKLSGAGGMFGVGGMNPFGGPRRRSTFETSRTEETDEPQEELPQAIPILPVVKPESPVSQAQESASSDLASNVSDIQDELDPSDLRDDTEEGTNLRATTEEEENESEEDEVLELPAGKTTPEFKNFQEEHSSEPVKLDKGKIFSDGETTGYEGDEDTEVPIQKEVEAEEVANHEKRNGIFLTSSFDKQTLQDQVTPPIPSTAPPEPRSIPPVPEHNIPPVPSIPPPATIAPSAPVDAAPSVPAPSIVPVSTTAPAVDLAGDLTGNSSGPPSPIKHRGSVDSSSKAFVDVRGPLDRSVGQDKVSDLTGLVEQFKSLNWATGIPQEVTNLKNKKLVYEIEESTGNKRGFAVHSIEYFILFSDYAQLLVTVTKHTSGVSTAFDSLPPPVATKQDLHKYSGNYGFQLYELGSKFNGKVVAAEENFVIKLIEKIPGVIKPINDSAVGVSVFDSRDKVQIDGFKPGDIVVIENALFQGHNKFHQKIHYQVGADGPLSTILSEFDQTKIKFRVFEKDSKNKVKTVSYKLSDMIEGRFQVFRLVGRGYVKWPEKS